MGNEIKRKDIKKTMKRVGVGFLVGILVGACLGIGVYKGASDIKNKETVTTAYISGKLEDIGTLNTQEVTYSSRQTVEKGEIPFITKKGFTMEYNATMKAGIEVEDIEVPKITAKKVTIRVPHAEIQENKVDPNSVKFVDEQKAILNWNTQEDVTEAIALAEENAKNDPAVDTSMLIEQADEHLEELIHLLLDDSVGDREVVVEFQ